MIVLQIFPVILSFLFLAAHFSRADLLLLTLISLLIPFLLFFKRVWVVRIIQLLLIAGAFEWVRAMFQYIGIRKILGEDWIRLAIILSVVAIFTLASGLVFQTKSVKKVYIQATNKRQKSP